MKFNKINTKYFNVSIFISFFLIYFLFFLSLERCYEGEDKCCMRFKWIKKKIIQESISILLTIIIFVMMLLKIISKIHLIHFILMFLLFYEYSNGITFDDHGYYNIKFFFVITIPSFILLYIFKFLLSIKNKKIVLIFIFLSLLILLEIFFSSLLDCSDWEKGLNNTFIENNKNDHGCLILIPKSCTYKIGKYFFDRFSVSSPKCYKQALKSREALLKFSKSPYINKNTIHIGFPAINKDDKIFQKEISHSLSRYVSKNLIDMGNLTLINSLKNIKPEISIDYSNSKTGEIKVDLNFNKTLSEERKKLERFTEPYSTNILILYIDSVSRANSIRQLKKTLKFFEKFMLFRGNHNPNFPSENFHSFQFFKYHSHDFYTPGNYPLLFYGNHRNETKKYITVYLKKNGYITAYSSDSCSYDFVNSFHNFSTEDLFDHHYAICDPLNKPINSELKCFHGNYHFLHIFEYMNQFWRKYENNRKYSIILTNFAHVCSVEILKYMDNAIFDYFNRLFKDNLLKNTSIFLLSDHGASLPTVYFLNDFYQIERHLPMLYLIVNDRKNQTYDSQYRYIHKNQQAFITAFDIHDTIIHLIYGDKFFTKTIKGIKSKYGESLFNNINSKQRSPKIYKHMSDISCI